MERAGSVAAPELRLRTEAAVAWVEGQHERAELLTKQALAEVSTLTPSGSDEYEKDRLEHILTAVDVASVARPRTE